MGEGAEATTELTADEAAEKDQFVDGKPENVEVRCKFCDKFLTKLIVTVDMLAAGGKRKVVKVGFETKCPRCRQFVYHLFVA